MEKARRVAGKRDRERERDPDLEMVELSLKVNRSQQQHSAAGNPVALPYLDSRRVDGGSYGYISYYSIRIHSNVYFLHTVPLWTTSTFRFIY